MFLHHTMTDPEILRTCEGCESPHLRLVADRLRQRVQDLSAIGSLASAGRDMFDVNEIRDTFEDISEICKNGK